VEFGQSLLIEHISVVIITKNAEQHLEKCLNALHSFREIVLLDSGSTDTTLSLAAKYPNVRIYHQEFKGFGQQKNKAVSLAKNDWVFSLDSDEVPDAKCIQGIIDLTLKKNTVGFIKRLNYYRNKPVEACGWQDDWIPRLFNRTHTAFAEKIVHEVVDTSKAEIVKLPGLVHHYAFSNPSDLIQKLQFYSTLYAHENRFRKNSSPALIAGKTFFSFIRNYFLQKGILYGYEGFLISYSNSAGVFYKYMKLYELNKHLKISLLITTYNRPETLELVLYSAFRQTLLPGEIIVADDGSGEDTKKLVERLSKISPVPMKHVWHEDKGFRASEIRNKGIAAAKSEYVVIVDGDMVLNRNFIKSHARAARPGFFVQGSRVLLSEALTQKKIKAKSISFTALMPGITNRLNAINFPLLSPLVSKVTNSFAGVRSANMAFWKADVIKMNGFDNDFIGWGREDSEFCARLLHNGILRRNLKLGGVAYHLYHPESSREKLVVNDSLLDESLKTNRLRCTSGIDKFLSHEDSAK
jgi:glycosyltransferase involved in cell wall biosynthesis